MPIPLVIPAAVAKTRVRFVAVLMILAVLAPAALVAAKYPKWWLWIAPEQTPMTWLQSVLLILAACAAALITVIGKARGWTRWQRLPYAGSALGLGALAMDERFAIHERVRDRILAPRDVPIPGPAWVGPDHFLMLAVAVAGLMVLSLLLRALRPDRLALALGCLGVVVAAIAVAMAAIDPATMPMDVERLEQTAEECVKLLADCLFVAAIGVRLLALVGERVAPIVALNSVAADDDPAAATRRLRIHDAAAVRGHPPMPRWAPPDAASVPPDLLWSPAPAPELTAPYAAHH